MSTIVLRLVKGVPLTNAELDDNFSNLNTDKLEAGTTATLTNKTINLSSNTFVATSAQMATAVSDKTGSGALVFATSPTLVTPALGTPASGVVTNLTGTASININGTVGATTATTGAFTTLTTSSTVTINGGTANGVAYLNGSKVLTTGSTLAFLNGNLLVGSVATPSPSDIPSIEMETAAIFGQRDLTLSCNAYYQSGWKYQGTGFATRYYLDRTNGNHLWEGANSGSAGAGLGFATRMTLTASGVLQLTNNLQLPNNLQFTGTGNRITGDFSTTTFANRVFFQTTTAGGGTGVGAIPNATGANSAFNVYGSPDAGNSSFGQFRAGSDTGDVRITSSLTGTGTYVPMTFYTGGSERVRIDTAGNVGIGTSSPTNAAGYGALTLNGTTGSFLALRTNGTDTAYVQTNASSFDLKGVNNVPMILYTNNAERARIDSAGNILVGVGTTADAHLKVYGAGTTSSSYTNGDATGATLYLRDSGTLSGNGGQLLFGSGFGVHAGIKGLVVNGTGPAGDLLFQTRGTSGNVDERMRINYLGNVGIGLSSPSQKLQVVGNIAAGDNTATADGFVDIAGASTGSVRITRTGTGATDSSMVFSTTFATLQERMRISSSGNVGIGTSSPNGKLHVQGSGAGGTIAALHPGNTSFGTVFLGETTGGTDDPLLVLKNYNGGSPVSYGISCTDDGSLAFKSGANPASNFGTERARIDSSGNLLVGTTSLNGPGTSVVVGGLFRTVAGSGTINNATSITLFSPATFTTYLVTVQTPNANGLSTTALVHYPSGGNPIVKTNLVLDNAGFSITISGGNVQVTNTLGGLVGYTFSALRIF